MSDIVIKAENLGKKYTIGHQAERGGYMSLRDVLMQNARTLWSKTKDLGTGKAIIQGDTMEEVWALKDVSFDIRRGEAVGIIGRNGAGKSTLLKVLSRITEPSTGRVTIKGRVASLLEVGTGFHPELSGRENIYLNGTILGMTRVEVKQKFDEIVAFAEVEKYLDTPVKRYSSGMYVRLAFAVAAHLEPEILVVDEVLAVGDAEFQKKCLGKMGDVATEGRTVLFVSHNMRAINSLCAKSLLLNNGKVDFSGKTTDVISRYLTHGENQGQITWEKEASPGGDILELLRVSLLGNDKKIRTIFSPHENITVEVEFILKKAVNDLRIGVGVKNSMDEYIFITDTYHLRAIFEKEGAYCARCIIPKDFLNCLEYSLYVGVNVPMKLVIIKGFECLRFKVEGYLGNRSLSIEPSVGMIAPELEWNVVRM